MPDKEFSADGFDFIWDEEKNILNYKKHGIHFETAALVFNDDLRIEFQDELHSEEEQRFKTIGIVHDILTVVYCDRKNKRTGSVYIRLISARLATKAEQALYNNNIAGRQ